MLNIKTLLMHIVETLNSVDTKTTGLGTYVSDSPDSAIALVEGISSQVCSVSLGAGTWVVECGVRFSSVENSSNTGLGFRRANLTTSSASDACNIQVQAVNGGVTQLRWAQIVKPTSTTTYYLNAAFYDITSSNTLAVITTGTLIRAVRII